jgi:hypothetical protein
MIGTLRRNEWRANPKLEERPREGRGERRSNLTWLARVAPPERRWVQLLLLGGRRPGDFRVRVAQSHVRSDLTPSHWSHVCLLGALNPTSPGRTEILEVSLEPRRGFGFPTANNGVQLERLERYRDARSWPNLALLALPVDRVAIERQVLQVIRSRSAVDLLELTLRWLGFVWGVAGVGNPLFDGAGVPAAVLVETLLSAAGFDITPSLPARLSCPEAIWQAARWWHGYYSATAETEARVPEPIAGVWCVDDRLVEVSENVPGTAGSGA